MSVAILTVVVSHCRVLLGVVMLSVGVIVRCLQMVVRGCVVVCGSLPVMLDSRVFGLLCHGFVLP
jgi:hypothetical protein